MNNYLLISKGHLLFSTIREKGKNLPFSKILELDEDFHNNSELLEKLDLSKDTTIFDFTLLETSIKISLLNFLKSNFKGNIVSDLTCYNGKFILEKYPQIKVAGAFGFYSPKKKFETVNLDEKIYKLTEEIFSELGYSLISVSDPGIGFHLPRIVSTIINEAYYSLSDELASKNAIDTAMKFGVNYPLGPFEWEKKNSPSIVKNLLIELQMYTGDLRYRPSEALT